MPAEPQESELRHRTSTEASDAAPVRPTSNRIDGARGRSSLALAHAGRVVSRLFDGMRQDRRDQFAALRPPADHVVLLGDSITEYGLWPEWIPDRPVLNRGIGGDTSAGILARLDTAIADPRAVCLLIGTNDLSLAIPQIRIVDNVRRILDGIMDRAPGAPIIVQSVMPRTAKYRAEIQALNAALQRLVDASPAQVSYLDLWPALADHQGTLRSDCSRDHLHLTGAGYQAWAQILRPVLADLPSRS